MTEIQSEEIRELSAEARPRNHTDRAWGWFALVLLLLVTVALIWNVVGKIGDAGRDRTTAPFAEINFPPLIRGEGLGDGSTPLPWPADFSAPTLGDVGGEGGSDIRRTVPRMVPSRNRSRAEVGLRSEGPALAVAERSFEALDLNDDGRMSPAEFAIYRAASAQPSEKGSKADDMPPYVATKALNKTVGELRDIDQDNDWFLSRREFATAARRAAHVQFR